MENKMTCSRCGFVGEEKFFTKSNRTKDGKRGTCKKCKSKMDKQYRETHKAELAEYFHNAWITNKNGVREKNRNYVDKRRIGMTAKEFENAVCGCCGITNAEHIAKYGHRLTVHHGKNTGRHNMAKGEEPVHEDLHVLCQSCHTTIGNLTHRDYANQSEASKKAWKTRRKNGTDCKHMITYNGKTQSLREWAEETGICYSTLIGRIFGRNWDIERALTTKDGRCRNESKEPVPKICI